MTPKIRMRRPPSKTGSSIFPVSCRYPHIITYTEASVITAGSSRVETVPTWVAMKLFTCPVNHVKKLVHIRESSSDFRACAADAPQSIGAKLFCDPMSERRLASAAFVCRGCAGAARRPRTTLPSPASRCRVADTRTRDGTVSSFLPQPPAAISHITVTSVRVVIRRYQVIGVKVVCAPCCFTAASRASCAFCNCCA